MFPAPPRACRYVILVLIVIVIGVWVRYGNAIPVPVTVITCGVGYTVTFRVPRFLADRARFS